MRMFQTNIVEQITTHFMFDNSFFQKSRPLRHNVEKYGTARQDTHDNIFACWITKATDTQSEYVILIALPRQQ